MSDTEEMVIIGTLLPQFSEDEIPTKKPTIVADQIAVDSNGKRRFHGAFTGGFSAGFWNTVGSLEGWQPKSFKSSRNEKAAIKSQKPDDFMDEEDVGEFGIAPHRIQTTEEFTDDRPRKKSRISLESDGPVRGNPVKDLFLAPVKGKISISLLRKMGWKDEDGFRTISKGKSNQSSSSTSSQMEAIAKVYNCDMGPMQKESRNDEEDIDGPMDEDVSISGECVKIKINRFGLGYVGLSKYTDITPSEHVHLFAQLEAKSIKDKKLPIKGQAFGVGAFEEDDDDIYTREDMTTYDFTLGEKLRDESKAKQNKIVKKSSTIPGCVGSSKKNLTKLKLIYTVEIPETFQPINWAVRKTRFGPSVPPPDSSTKIEPTYHNPESRKNILLDDAPKKTTEIVKDLTKPILDKVPEKDLTKKIKIDYSKTLSEKIAFDRFVSEKDVNDVSEPIAPPAEVTVVHEIKCKRTRTPWQPCKMFCQKMNIAEPITGYKKSNNKTFLFFENVASAKKNRRRTELNLVPSTESDLDDNEIIKLRDKSLKRNLPLSVENKKVPQAVDLIASTSAVALSSSNKRSNVIQKVKSKPVKKTELELRVDENLDKHPVEKKDLFKSIFSSSEDESEGDEKNEIEKISTVSEIRPSVLQQTALPSANQILSLLSNPSIFKSKKLIETKVTEQSGNDDATRPKIEYVSKKERDSAAKPTNVEGSKEFDVTDTREIQQKPVEVASEEIVDDLIYGPRLPENIIMKTPSVLVFPTANKPQRTGTSSSGSDEWIDKAEVKRKRKEHRRKKSKKHKKHKSSKSK